MHAQQHGLIGISMTNSNPAVCPTRSRKAALGTNPISLATPANNEDGLVLGTNMSLYYFSIYLDHCSQYCYFQVEQN